MGGEHFEIIHTSTTCWNSFCTSANASMIASPTESSDCRTKYLDQFEVIKHFHSNCSNPQNSLASYPLS